MYETYKDKFNDVLILKAETKEYSWTCINQNWGYAEGIEERIWATIRKTHEDEFYDDITFIHEHEDLDTVIQETKLLMMLEI